MEGDENDLVNRRKRIVRKKEDLRPRTYYQEVRKVNVQERMVLRKTKRYLTIITIKLSILNLQ